MTTNTNPTTSSPYMAAAHAQLSRISRLLGGDKNHPAYAAAVSCVNKVRDLLAERDGLAKLDNKGRMAINRRILRLLDDLAARADRAAKK